MVNTSKQQSHSQKVTSHVYSKVWLYFMYYWIIFGIGCYFGQYLPNSWRQPLSFGLLLLILATLVIKRARRYGLIISHIYAIVVGVLSYATFTTYLQNLGPDVFYKNIALAIIAFIAFGIIGYFVIGDASSIGKYLFVTLIALIIASLIGFFLHNPIFYTVITVVSLLLFLMYTLYDFNRLKRGQFSPREMGFNLFINLLNIIKDILRLANTFKR
ncbi:Bax inhibitor-1/YccA family protein [Staphylococcus simiae]|uniref:Bax inhibitor-1/YccA family protein n=1 Tax=Staphylococcus simiae TaxID=308354 RepID=UPI001A97CB64|nr:Bax inhibitor-1 family protein [Staphylococcus simiae]MBO1198842.1 Bax inhibitor-1/YccA family protein [Staphylococcus simiae]MBO1201039.1 Bax inhibitor-1/YccA family protein [Staphylococcus simiae]MBO1204040.1 Bax inhibitor-1/YccA family protein [Staphylococcus simiae]MBO1211079.1 Bax inhibitor-1/YccA family protein [Staphylococcus simiae]MBO1229368.1 Bax inhibitor-1/YccA family protein [Staphylococcus simiae]